METSVFDYREYKAYLRDRLATSGPSRGMRSRVAEALGCQTAFISQVLSGTTHFSLEHALKISAYLEHARDEESYFLLLVQHDRAGTSDLKKYFRGQLDSVQKNRQQVRERVQARPELSKEAQMIYYSAWHYAAVHILLSVPGFDSKRAIADHLGVPLPLVSEVLDFLSSTGLAVQEAGKFRIGKTRLHLPGDSPLVSKHHANWRMRAMQVMDRKASEDLFFSSVYSLSEADALKIRNFLLDTIEKSEPILRKSKEESVFCLSMDFFRL